MTKNSPEALQKIVENLVIDLEQNQDCSEWECVECPFWIEHIEEEPAVWKTHMWLANTYNWSLKDFEEITIHPFKH